MALWNTERGMIHLSERRTEYAEYPTIIQHPAQHLITYIVIHISYNIILLFCFHFLFIFKKIICANLSMPDVEFAIISNFHE